MVDQYGNAGWKREMDATGYLEQAFTIVGPDGRPMNSENGWAIKRSSYNDKGNITEQSYFDERGFHAINAGVRLPPLQW